MCVCVSDSNSAQRRQQSQLAFRRRSISEDTCDRPPPSRVVTAPPNGGEQCADGIVCSDDDLRSIVFLHRLRHSLSPSYAEPETEDRVIFDIGSPGDDYVTTVYSPLLSPAVDVRTGSGSIGSIRSDDVTDHVVTSQPSRRSSKIPVAAVPEVVYDEYGQTWDVYGAEFDPEILGRAIQTHLEKLMTGVTVRMQQQQPTMSNCKLSVGDGRSNRLVSFIARYFCSSWHHRATEQVTNV